MLMLIYEDADLCWAVGPCRFNRSATKVYRRLVFNTHITLTHISKHKIKTLVNNSTHT